ncbi:hypothetical protein GWK48_08910 [Metallosphaera tengchongensis]|uniref:Uncharacterized protein n=1 Tax=Metallosphaera tengchongensis TaxID=1532350 RepID=A0A6N0NW60_9CREN|nr:hypothetical protein GWK48_08910 [Metallosphaera tengchongensis]
MTRKLKVSVISLGQPDVVVFGKDMELPAYTLSRAITSLEGRIIKILNVYEFAFLDSPYVESQNVVFLINDEGEANELSGNVRSLGINGSLFTCNDKVSIEGLKVSKFKDELCEVNLSLSLLSYVVSGTSSPRSKRISQELDFSDLSEWLNSKVSEFQPSLDLVLSPVLFPSLGVARRNLGKRVKGFYENNFSDSNVVYTGVDQLVGKRLANHVRVSGKRVKEILMDSDPLTAPIYLSIISYILKSRISGS